MGNPTWFYPQLQQDNEEQQQRRLQRREEKVAELGWHTERQNNGKHDLQLTEIDEKPENNVTLLSRDNII